MGSRASGMPTVSSARMAAAAISMAFGLAMPTSSLAWTMIRRTMILGSTPAVLIRANQASAASLSEPRRDLQKAESMS